MRQRRWGKTRGKRGANHLLHVERVALLQGRLLEGGVAVESVLQHLDFLSINKGEGDGERKHDAWVTDAMAVWWYPDDLLEVVVFDVHVLDRVEQGHAVLESLVHLGQRFAHALPRIGRAQVLGHIDADRADAVDQREQHGHHLDLTLCVGARHAERSATIDDVAGAGQ